MAGGAMPLDAYNPLMHIAWRRVVACRAKPGMHLAYPSLPVPMRCLGQHLYRDSNKDLVSTDMNAIGQKIDMLGAALKLRAQRQQLLATNIANADTPGYKAVDFDFAAALGRAAGGRIALATTRPGHLAGRGSELAGAAIKYRIPAQDSIDGNTVEIDRETALFTENALSYQASAQFLGDTIRSMRLAISGQSQ
jgi:flagellar basal-body rod protein FlgB